MRRLLPLLLSLLTAALVAGCGSSTSSSSGTDDPARAVPASSLLYLAVQVRPEGDAKSGVEAAGRKILAGRELGPELQKLIDKELRSQDLSYGKDVAPWLGRRAAVAITGYGGPSRADAVLAVNSRDDAKAAEFVKKSAKNDQKASYKGVDYYTSSSSAVGVTGGYLLLGSTPAAFRTAVDTVKGGASLADSSTYRKATGKVTTDGLGLVFVDTKRFLDVVGQTSSGAQALAQLRSLPQFRNLGPTAAAMTADGDAIRVEAPAPANADESTADAVAKLPADSWLAIAAPKAGEQLRTQLNALPGVQRQQFEQAKRLLLAQTGLDLDRDVLSWIKGFSIFATGTTIPDLKAGIVIDSSDPAASRRALDRIAALLARQRSTPLRRTPDGFELPTPQGPVTFAVTGDRVLIAFGKDTTAALEGSNALAGSATYQDAEKALGGGRPAFLISVPTILQFARNLGAGRDAGYRQAEPYLKAFGAITAGVVESGGKKVSRVAVGLR